MCISRLNAFVILLLCFNYFKSKSLIKFNGSIIIDLHMPAKQGIIVRSQLYPWGVGWYSLLLEVRDACHISRL